ncbi:unnamed protein product, partial [Vitis vinifera]
MNDQFLKLGSRESTQSSDRVCQGLSFTIHAQHVTGKITLFTDHNRYLSEMMNTVRVTMACQTLRMMGFVLIISAPYLLRPLALLW